MKKFFYTMVAGATLALAACTSQPQAEMTPQKKDIGLQLYSIRQLIGNAEKFAENQEKEALFLVDEINRLTVGNDYKYKDIAILYRTKAQANVLETVFTKSGLPHRLLAGLRFYDHAEVKDMIAYLRFLHNKSDFISFSRIINVPRRGIGQATVEKIKDIANENGIDFYQVLTKADEFPDLKRSYAKLSEFYRLMQ